MAVATMANYKGKRDKSIRRFTVKGSEARNYKEALERFRSWHNHYYSNDKVEILRVEHVRTFLITYRILRKGDRQQTRLD